MTDFAQMDACDAAAATSPSCARRRVHLAAQGRQGPARALETNILGTANVVKLCMRARSEADLHFDRLRVSRRPGKLPGGRPRLPVNKYAWSKLGGECAVRMYDRALIVPDQLRPERFPVPKAFVDQWTSRESVAAFAAQAGAACFSRDVTGVIHVGGPRRRCTSTPAAWTPPEIKRLVHHRRAFHVPRGYFV